VLSIALACAAGSLLCWPTPDRSDAARRLLPAAVAGRVPLRGTVGAGAAVVAVVVGIASTPLVAALAAGAVLGAGRAFERRRERLLDERRLRGLADALAGFAADLRAGRSAEASALTACRGCPDDLTAAALGRALRAPEAVQEPPPGSGAWGEAVCRIAAGVRLSTRTGCSLAAVACAAEDDVRSRLRQQRDLRTAVAAPQASAFLLAGLPLLALAMGSGIGADPWRVLLSTPVGNLLLVVGTALEVAGLTWSSRLVRRALP
jgi:tight adherence protein B